MWDWYYIPRSRPTKEELLMAQLEKNSKESKEALEKNAKESKEAQDRLIAQ